MEISKLLLSNYLPYAKSTIISRAIPSIDGLKPVQRRLLYTMYKMGLLTGDKAKSQRINGQTMALHPHGDSSIYETMVLMTTGYEGLNVPYIESKGSFGKAYSRDLRYSAPRYTEAKLAPICQELFDGISEDSVEFIDNFDATVKEPTLLPVKFPSILVNTNSGVAVGTSSNIPSFSLKNVCLATQGIINGTITTPAELAKVLGAPEFTTGGFLHASEKSLEKLCETGRGSFMISGKVEVYNDKIVITEIPYCTTAEDIMDAISNAIKEKKMHGIKDVRDEIGLDGLRIVVEIKGGYKSREVLQELCRMTTLRTSISFRTRVIIGNRCREVGILELLQNWIEFRQQCICNMYTYRLNKDSAEEHLLTAWEKIKHDIPGVVQMISKNTVDTAKNLLMANYGLDDDQAEYLLDMKIRSITTDKAEASLNKLANLRENIKYYTKVVGDKNERKAIIVKELTEIINKYGKDNNTMLVDELNEDDLKAPKVKISDELVTVVLTKEGFVRRLTTLRDIQGTFSTKNGDVEVMRWNLKNDSYILVFDRFGTVHKILADSIDSSSRANLTDKLHELAGLEKPEDIIWADVAGDYDKYFNLIYPDGKGVRVYYDKAKGVRSYYKSLYKEVEPRHFFITTEDKFFLITNRLKASYCDLTNLGVISNRTAFKVCRFAGSEYPTRLQPAKDVPNIGLISLERYSKDYTVTIGDDVLWIDPEQIKRAQELMKKEAERFKQAEAEENGENDTIEEEESVTTTEA